MLMSPVLLPLLMSRAPGALSEVMGTKQRGRRKAGHSQTALEGLEERRVTDTPLVPEPGSPLAPLPHIPTGKGSSHLGLPLPSAFPNLKTAHLGTKMLRKTLCFLKGRLVRT